MQNSGRWHRLLLRIASAYTRKCRGARPLKSKTDRLRYPAAVTEWENYFSEKKADILNNSSEVAIKSALPFDGGEVVGHVPKGHHNIWMTAAT